MERGVRQNAARAALCAAAAAFSLADASEASPWVLRPGRIAASSGVYYQYANSEFFSEGANVRGLTGEIPFSLRGQFHSGTMFAGLRAGVAPRFEFELTVPFRLVSYTADPVILLPRPMDFMGLEADYYRRNIINLSRAAAGVADINLALRYQFLSISPLVMAAELRFKMPTGYAPPQGTFGDRPTSTADFLARAGELVRPANIRDDVTLGDGQLDVSASVLMGLGFRTGTFVRLDATFVARTEGAGQQIQGSLRVGQSIGRLFVFFAGVTGQYSVTQGKVIGISVAALDPTIPAEDYGRGNDPTFNLLLREVRLDRDLLDVSGGVIARLSPSTELNLSYARTVAGRNVSATNTIFLSVTANTDWSQVVNAARGR
ncbi:MAG: hypothetical protein JNK05_35110 [Myxococcales bacterium]|nr:hypothetical protein [Myxococcales bacterium]